MEEKRMHICNTPLLSYELFPKLNRARDTLVSELGEREIPKKKNTNERMFFLVFLKMAIIGKSIAWSKFKYFTTERFCRARTQVWLKPYL